MNSHIVLGLGFGDEGKGLVTSSLVTSLPKPIVVRFNGGHQAGHTVVKRIDSITDRAGNEAVIRHVFSNFGSGTLHGAPTIWSKFCTFSPIGFFNEWHHLKKLGIEPKVFVDMDCPIVTNMDQHANVLDRDNMINGSTGTGFGKAIQREQDHYHLRVRDMFHPNILHKKLYKIHNYYGLADTSFVLEMERTCNWVSEHIIPFDSRKAMNFLKKYENIIFEGAQGIMLDQHYGFFPHVTRSNTTSENARELIADWNNDMAAYADFIILEPTVYYVTRAYQTRHGNGPMTNEGLPLDLRNIENETNVENQYQGKFRRSVLDLDLLRYAISVDIPTNKKKLAITCIDQVANKDGYIPFTTPESDGIMWGPPRLIAEALDIELVDSEGRSINNMFEFNNSITKQLF